MVLSLYQEMASSLRFVIYFLAFLFIQLTAGMCFGTTCLREFEVKAKASANGFSRVSSIRIGLGLMLGIRSDFVVGFGFGYGLIILSILQ